MSAKVWDKRRRFKRLRLHKELRYLERHPTEILHLSTGQVLMRMDLWETMVHDTQEWLNDLSPGAGDAVEWDVPDII
jgi:hypothetical protein